VPKYSYIGSEGNTIAYREAGSGTPVLLIHGFTVDSEFNWVEPGIFKALAEKYHVFAMDVRGHGKSAKPVECAAYGEHILDDITELIDSKCAGRAHVVGYSMGGEIALAYAVKRPERVYKAVVGGGGLVTVDDDKYALWELDARRLRAAEPQDKVSEIRFPGISLPDSVLKSMDANDPAALGAVAEGMLQLALASEELANNDTPMLLLTGEYDEFKYTADRALAIGSNIRMKVLKGCGHMDAIADPGFTRFLLNFLCE
jgi:pimeloyl-ACP methyl ester carboxylesterase